MSFRTPYKADVVSSPPVERQVADEENLELAVRWRSVWDELAESMSGLEERESASLSAFVRGSVAPTAPNPHPPKRFWTLQRTRALPLSP